MGHGMSSDLNLKYIKRYSRGWIVHIRKAGKRHSARFSMLRYGSLDAALLAAQSHRDRVHYEMFGYPVSTRLSHGGKRKGSETEFKGLILPVGMTLQRVRGEPTYFVIKPFQEGDRKLRFNLRQLGLQRAYELASAALAQRRLHPG